MPIPTMHTYIVYDIVVYAQSFSLIYCTWCSWSEIYILLDSSRKLEVSFFVYCRNTELDRSIYIFFRSSYTAARMTLLTNTDYEIIKPIVPRRRQLWSLDKENRYAWQQRRCRGFYVRSYEYVAPTSIKQITSTNPDLYSQQPISMWTENMYTTATDLYSFP